MESLMPGQTLVSSGNQARLLFMRYKELFESIRGARSYPPEVLSEVTGLVGGSESLTQQHEAVEADINVIMARFMATGAMPNKVDIGMFGDFTDIEDFESAVERVDRAYEAFMQLPAVMREKFGNDPGRLMARAREFGVDALSQELNAATAPVAARDAGTPPVAPPGEGSGEGAP